MKLLYWLRRLYSLDTLDTRFTVSAKTPLTATHEAPIDPSKQLADGLNLQSRSADGRIQDAGPGTQPSKWPTPEFFVYYIAFLTIVPNMFRVVYDVSKESHPAYPKYAHLLSPGWIPGRKVDNSDTQYASFRNNIPYMFVVLLAHPLLRRVHNITFPVSTKNPPTSNTRLDKANGNINYPEFSTSAEARSQQRISYDLLFALIFLAALHGFSAIKVLLILYINFTLATQLPRKYVPAATWIFNIGILFENELCHGYTYSSVVRLFLPTTPFVEGSTENQPPLAGWGAWLDSYGGLIPRWEILFNITVLRLISFNLDYYWSLDYRAGSPIEKKQLDPSSLSERDRVAIPAFASAFTFRNYLSYVLYSPLYLAGPILTFNDYISQTRYPSPSITTTRTLLYGIRFLLTLLTMELVLHYLYAVAISKAQPDWSLYTPFQLSMLAYFNLHIIWLKLLIPWRFFRLWALIDGIDPPENMVRCMSDNYSALAFWRGWHRSFNRWIVRYIYIPIGGSGGSKVRAIANFMAVFTFVALWHDINLRLLAWGWLVTLFVLPEILATLAFPARKWRDRPTAYRVLCGVGAVGNILMMMAANLVGFAVGLDGLKGLVEGIVGSWSGLGFLICACVCLFIGVQIMFEVREGEKRNGIKLKC